MKSAKWGFDFEHGAPVDSIESKDEGINEVVRKLPDESSPVVPTS